MWLICGCGVVGTQHGATAPRFDWGSAGGWVWKMGGGLGG